MKRYIYPTKIKMSKFYERFKHPIGGVSFIGIVTLIYFSFYPPQKEPFLIFAGGGSVNNYLKDNFSLKVDEGDNEGKPIYINMPSGDALKLLEEEHSRFSGVKSENKSLSFICLSATEIKDTNKLKIDTNSARICEVYLGVDHLRIYLLRSLKNQLYRNDAIETNGTLTKSGWETILSKKKYTTTSNSGTLSRYKEYLKDSFPNLVDSLKTYDVFNDRMNLNDSDGVYFASEYYKPSFKQEQDVDFFVLKGDPYKKLYLYFLAYLENEKYTISEPIIRFLDKIKDKENGEGSCVPLEIWKLIEKRDTFEKVCKRNGEILNLSKKK